MKQVASTGGNTIHVNEQARTVLKAFWQKSVYEDNILLLLPQMADDLDEGYYFVTGVKAE